MSEKIIFGIFLALYAILLFCSRKEKVPKGLIDEEERTAKWKEPFGKAAVFLWKKRKRHSGRSGSKDLITLQKIQAFLIFGMLAAVLGLLVALSSEDSAEIQDGKLIARDSYDGEEKDVTATVQLAGQKENGSTQELPSGSAEELGEFVIHVEPRKYTRKETDALAQQVFEELPSVMKGENPDLQHVSRTLNLVSSLEAYPFRISWESSDYELVDSDGRIQEHYEEGWSKEADLKCLLSYNGWHYEKTYALTVVSDKESTLQRRSRLIREALEQEEKQQESSEVLTLPTQVDGQQLVWVEKKENNALLIFGIVLAAGIVNCILIDRRQQEKKEKRRRELQLEYPQLISKFVLFLGAGMSVRNIFYKLKQEYDKDKAAGMGRKEAYEEILLACRELDSGIPEAVVYSHFGQRLEIRQYTRMTTLLIQNLRKGNSDLLHVLQEEAQAATQERRQLARQLGEEAGTKLVVPMVMMLAVTMVIIIIPAFIGFSV